MSSPVLTVRTVTPEQHLDFLRSWTADGGAASFLQTPAWGEVKSEWRRESLGWFDGQELVGVGLVLYRQLPKVKRYLAYLPEGPVVDWDAEDLRAWLNPMVRHLRKAGAFGVRMGPPVVTRRWDAAAVKAGVADEGIRRLGDVPPTERSQAGARVVSQLQELGWKPQTVEGGFAAGQPQFVFQVPLAGAAGPLTEADVLAGMNQLWRRNIKKADKAGVEVTSVDGTAPGELVTAELERFHKLYVETARRD
ncbi:MAG: lipid II:glycine glycyltransferase FemX, partial [Nocardioidaceae bacterium]